MKQPCEKYCPDRSAECHASCEKWRAYEIERNKVYEARKATGDMTSILNDIERKRKMDIATGRMGARRYKNKR